MFEPLKYDYQMMTLQYDEFKIEKVNEEMINFVNLHNESNIHENCIILLTTDSLNVLNSDELPPCITRCCPNPIFKTKLNEDNNHNHRMIQQHRLHKWREACKSIHSAEGKTFYRQLRKLSIYKTINKTQTIIANRKHIKLIKKRW